MQTPAPWAEPEPLPMPIESERLVLRWLEPRDARSLHEAVEEDRDSLLPWLPWAEDDHATVEASARRIAWFEGIRADPDQLDYTMGLFERSTGALLGGSGLHRIIPAWRDAEVGYWLRASRRGEGFCTESTVGLITSAFEQWGFRRIRLVCAGGNTPSQGVPARLGIRLEGRERANRWVDGRGWEDTLTYGVLREEWDADRGRVRA